jgi:hypothetical protein
LASRKSLKIDELASYLKMSQESGFGIKEQTYSFELGFNLTQTRSKRGFKLLTVLTGHATRNDFTVRFKSTEAN